MTQARTPSEVDAIAERHLDAEVAHDPLLATYLGIPGLDDQMPALDPDWLAERSEIRQRTLRELAAAEPRDANDRITAAAMRSELGTLEQLRALGTEEAALNNIDSPVQHIRDVFDLNPANTVDDWANIARRMAAVPDAVAGYLRSLRFAAERGQISARRQVEAAIKQCGDNVGPDGFFGRLAATEQSDDGTALPDSVRADLRHGAELAAAAYEDLENVLRDELLADAPEKDAVGREQYAPHSRRFLGASVDLDEAYEWGLGEVARITELMQQTADKIRPGGTVTEAIEFL